MIRSLQRHRHDREPIVHLPKKQLFEFYIIPLLLLICVSRALFLLILLEASFYHFYATFERGWLVAFVTCGLLVLIELFIDKHLHAPLQPFLKLFVSGIILVIAIELVPVLLIFFLIVFLSFELFNVLKLFKIFQEVTPALGRSQQEKSPEQGVLDA